MPVLKPREVVKKLKRLDFIEHHQVGSHLTMKNVETNRRAVVPMHLKDIKKGTLSAILREANISKEEFQNA
ncbi:type II toxin-antitoxin system HicA family toxin [Candidatus Gottesmanbacteria bacterium]|nr:type II toxin-antitoxin system HicA family toxin [Candidatus Gottesmanbacteria bacterium]